MKVVNGFVTMAAALALVASPAAAQQDANGTPSGEKPAAEPTASKATLLRPIEVQHMRPLDQRGLNVFETPKEAGVPFEGFKLSWSAAFTQQFQSLYHENEAQPNIGTNGVDANALMEIGKGFNNATANLYLNAQIAPGIRVALTSYLSSRHHNETWVKDGYLLVDESPIDVALLDNMMKYVTLKAGHYEINYGDAHFRRTDNGMALYNPFVGNLILDAFTTEVGGEVYVRAGSFLAMAGVTGGGIKGDVTVPDKRTPSYLAKAGFDKQVTTDLRTRLTGSVYRNARTNANTLYAGDRAGSRYYLVMENTAATTNGNFTSGSLNPNFRNDITAVMINPFVKFRGLEVFGVIEQSEGRTFAEAEDRTWNQYAADVVYRFLPGDPVYVGARYNRARGELAGMADKVGADRVQLGGGWFITPGLMLKGEWVRQSYEDFPATDIRNGGVFKGFVFEGVVAF